MTSEYSVTLYFRYLLHITWDKPWINCDNDITTEWTKCRKSEYVTL